MASAVSGLPARFASLWSMVAKQLRSTAQEASLQRYLSRTVPRATAQDPLLTVQCTSDSLFHYALFGSIVRSMRGRTALRVEQVITHSLNTGEAQSLVAFAALRLITNPLLIRKWRRMFSVFCDAVGYCSVSFRPFADLVDLRRALNCWRALDSRAALSNLKIDGLLVGDLVNDSFLRFRPEPTIDLRDRYLMVCLWQAHRDVRRAQAYFQRKRPFLYLTSYTTYVQHGIAARAALQSGAAVFAFGNLQEFAKQLGDLDWMQTKNADGYANGFSALSDQEVKLRLADEALAGRLAGRSDSATGYMRQSAYGRTATSVPAVRGAIVVFLHDFFDSPHIYRDMVFPDFWDWIVFTVATLRDAGIPFYVKPHPNQIGISTGVLNDLLREFPDLAMVPATVSNRQLADAGMAAAVTVYGSVAHEMAYLGVPTVACARHPHISFDFCRTAGSREEYAALLRDSRSPGFLAIDRSAMARQALAFYYMHNLNIGEDERALRDRVWGLFWICAGRDPAVRDLAEDLQEIAQMPGWQSRIDDWLAGSGR
jgi:hypothetical protein